MNWRVLFQREAPVPQVSEPACPGAAEPDSNDPYTEKRRRAVELLGERYVLHPTKALHRLPAGSGAGRGLRGVRR